MERESPLVASIRDLRPFTEWFHTQDDGQLRISRTTFGFITDDYSAYFGQATVGKKELTLDMVNGALKRVPDLDIYPEAPPDVTIASIPPDGGRELFIKSPKLSRYHELEGTGIAAKLLLQEIESLELLSRQARHPNIIKYHGCIVQRGRVVGIVLDRYSETLQDRLDSVGVEASERDTIIAKLESAIAHIHQTGHAHNDLNLSNVMISNGGSTEPVIVGFGSCCPVGQPLVPAGTPGWVDEKDWSTSALQNDEIAIARIRTWFADDNESNTEEVLL